MAENVPAVWFPAVRAGTGTDTFTIALADELRMQGVRTDITWLPHRAEYAPWSVARPKVPSWANIAHVNSWLARHLLPDTIPILSTIHLCVHDVRLRPYKGALQAAYHQHWIRRLELSNLDKASRVVAVSEYTLNASKASLSVSNIDVIHNGVDVHCCFEADERKEPHKPFRLLYSGNWSARKGVDLLKPILDGLGKDFELLFTGDRAGHERRWSLPRNSRPLGRVTSPSEMAKIYRDADALLFPTRLEGLPLAPIEAMSCGLPVVSSLCSSLPEVVDDGINGLLCRTDDVAHFVEAIRNLASSPQRWYTTKLAARAKAVRQFDIRQMAAKYRDHYAELLASS